MNYQVMNRVFAHSRAVGSQRMLLLAVARYADERGIAWPSYRTLADCMNLSRRQVQRLVHTAEQSGELAVVWRAACGRPNLYMLLCGLPAEQADALRARAAVLNQSQTGRELADAYRLARRSSEQSGLLDGTGPDVPPLQFTVPFSSRPQIRQRGVAFLVMG